MIKLGGINSPSGPAETSSILSGEPVVPSAPVDRFLNEGMTGSQQFHKKVKLVGSRPVSMLAASRCSSRSRCLSLTPFFALC
jgi:hypothetical protein